MPNSLITAFVEGLTETLPFRGLSVKTNRLNETLWTAVNDTNLKLRLPLYWDQLRKPRPKKAVYDASIQAGLAVLGSFAMITNTKQAIVRIEHGNATAVSFQPRPFGEANWTRDHGIMPVALQNSYSDPLLERDRADGPIPLTMDVSTRDILHMARKVADAVVKSSTTTMFADGVATFTFARRSFRPEARVIYRPLQANEPATVVTLATVG
jgi:hypothetical protein